MVLLLICSVFLWLQTKNNGIKSGDKPLESSKTKREKVSPMNGM